MFVMNILMVKSLLWLVLVNYDHEQVITDKSQKYFVIMSLDDFNAWQDTPKSKWPKDLYILPIFNNYFFKELIIGNINSDNN